MHRLRAAALLLVLTALLTGCSSIGRPQGQAQGAGYEAGDGSFTTWAAADRGAGIELTGQTYSGQSIDLADWRGEVVVVNFWYAACPPCRAEAADLGAIAAERPEIRMLGINPRDDAGTAQAFERTFAVPYPSLWDKDAAGVAAMQGLVPLQAMPTTLVLDREGRVAARILGQADPVILRGLIDDVVAEP